jgi:hypothetical protein
MTAMSAPRASEIADLAANPFCEPHETAVVDPTRHRRPRPPARDYSRTRVESRVLFRDADASEEPEWGASRFSLLEITSGLTDDSREAEERAVARRLADLRGRVKAARAIVAATPGLNERLQRDCRLAARFYTRFGISEGMFRSGVPAGWLEEQPDLPTATIDWRQEIRARVTATLPNVSDGAGDPT